MYSVFICHHVQAKLCGMDVRVYGFTSNHTKKRVMICNIYKIVIERIEILMQFLNHGVSYSGSLMILILI